MKRSLAVAAVCTGCLGLAVGPAQATHTSKPGNPPTNKDFGYGHGTFGGQTGDLTLRYRAQSAVFDTKPLGYHYLSYNGGLASWERAPVKCLRTFGRTQTVGVTGLGGFTYFFHVRDNWGLSKPDLVKVEFALSGDPTVCPFPNTAGGHPVEKGSFIVHDGAYKKKHRAFKQKPRRPRRR